MDTYLNDEFGEWIKTDQSGIYAKKGTDAERKIFLLEDPKGKSPQDIPYCTQCIITPEYVEIHYSGGIIRFIRKD